MTDEDRSTWHEDDRAALAEMEGDLLALLAKPDREITGEAFGALLDRARAELAWREAMVDQQGAAAAEARRCGCTTFVAPHDARGKPDRSRPRVRHTCRDATA